VPDKLSAILERSRQLGYLGPGEPAAHRAHAAAFIDAWDSCREAPPATFCDLGAGGGVPGLVLALHWPGTKSVLLEASSRRCSFLEAAILELGLATTVSVAPGRAETLARTSELEASFELVTARSFGPPAVVAECAARLLAPRGVLMVSEPPDAERTAARWPDEGLAMLALGPAVPSKASRHLVVIERAGPCPSRFPRRVGIPSKRPLF
jgi:16S rRNA (guanine527-N7)-methyltransferase